MPDDQAYFQAEKKIEPVNNHPRITTTNNRMPARIRVFVTLFVDGTVENKGGTHFKRYPAVKKKYLARWRKSENFWLRRTTILFQLGYKKETDFDLMCDIIRENLDSKEFFINKAIGWALRQYARTDPKAVKKFVKVTPLHPLSWREAMKHLE